MASVVTLRRDRDAAKVLDHVRVEVQREQTPEAVGDEPQQDPDAGL